MKFCCKCGTGINEGVFCEDCRPQEKQSKTEELTVCKCGRIFKGNRWVKADSRLIIKKYGGIAGVIQEGEKSKGNINFLYNVCPDCHKEKTEYHQGILQIRSLNQENLKRAFELVKTWAKEGVTKTEEQKNGVDLYFSDKRKERNIADKLHEQLGGTRSLNAQLFSHDKQRSKEIHRLNIFLEIPHFTKGQVLDVKDEPWLVTKIGKRMNAKNLIDGKKKDLKYDKDLKIMIIHDTTVSKVKPEVEALNPLTYQSEPLQNPKKCVLGEKIRVVCLHGLYII